MPSPSSIEMVVRDTCGVGVGVGVSVPTDSSLKVCRLSVSLSLLVEDPNPVMTREDNVNDSSLDNGWLVTSFTGCRTSLATNGCIELVWSSSWMGA